MDSVEKATAAIPAATVEDGREEAPPPPEPPAATAEEEREPEQPAPLAATADPWAGLLQTGLTLLEQLATAARSTPAAGAEGRPAGLALSFVARDERTGEPYLRFPMPSPE